MNRRAPRPLANALETLTARLAPRTQLARVQTVWPAAVGDGVAAHCVPVGARAGVLAVACDEAVWAAELELLAPELLERLEQLEAGLGITALRCRADLSRTPGFG